MATVFSDTFTDTNGTLLQSHTPTIGTSWVKHSGSGSEDATISSNQLATPILAGASLLYYANGTPGNANYSTQATMTITANSGGGVTARHSSSATTFYLARYLKSAGQWQLFKFVAGTATSLGTYSESITNGTQKVCKLTCSGSTITVTIDGTLRITATDSAITAAGFGGVRLGSATANDTLIDDYSVVDTVSPTPDTIPVTDSNLVAGCTPYNWIVSGSSLWTAHTPAGLQFSFSGTDLAMNVDVSSMSAYSAANYPYIVYSVDNGAFTGTQLTSATTAITLASGLSAGTHTVDIWQTKTYSLGDGWTPTNGLKITSFSVSSGGTTVSRTLPSTRVLIFGDSITRGRGLDETVNPGGDGLHAWSMAIAAALGARPGIVGISGQGWTNAGAGSEPDVEAAWNLLKSGTSRLSGGLLSPMPEHIVICHGTNDSSASDGAVTTAVTNTLTAIRAAAPDVPIFVILPFGQIKVSAITSGVVAVAGSLTSETLFEATIGTGSTDTDMYLINLGTNASLGITGPSGTAKQQSRDNLHPNEVTVNQISARVAACIGYITAGSSGGGGSSLTDEWDQLRLIARSNGLELITQ